MHTWLTFNYRQSCCFNKKLRPNWKEWMNFPKDRLSCTPTCGKIYNYSPTASKAALYFSTERFKYGFGWGRLCPFISWVMRSQRCSCPDLILWGWGGWTYRRLSSTGTKKTRKKGTIWSGLAWWRIARCRKCNKQCPRLRLLERKASRGPSSCYNDVSRNIWRLWWALNPSPLTDVSEMSSIIMNLHLLQDIQPSRSH